MDFFFYTFEHAINFGVASVPLILAFLLLKVFNLSPKSIIICILLNLMISVFFWLKLKDVHVALYQSIPYVLSLIWMWAESVLRKREEHNNSKEDDVS